MYEFRGATLQEAVHQALRYPALSTKKLAKAAAKFEAGFAAPAIYTFDPKDYPGYIHQDTANEESAADGHTAFATFVFSG